MEVVHRIIQVGSVVKGSTAVWPSRMQRTGNWFSYRNICTPKSCQM